MANYAKRRFVYSKNPSPILSNFPTYTEHIQRLVLRFLVKLLTNPTNIYETMTLLLKRRHKKLPNPKPTIKQILL